MPIRLAPIRLALSILVLSSLAAPALACSAGGGSTFCADGWIAAPVGRDRRADADTDDVPPPDDGPGAESGPGAEGGGEVWVDGAVPVPADPTPEDEGL